MSTGARPFRRNLASRHENGAYVLDRLQRQFAQSFEQMAEHIEAADVARPHDARFHLQSALEAATALQTTLQQIAQHCQLLEANIR
jgi:hypothetical protein